jgi:hypothetical protein
LAPSPHLLADWKGWLLATDTTEDPRRRLIDNLEISADSSVYSITKNSYIDADRRH